MSSKSSTRSSPSKTSRASAASSSTSSSQQLDNDDEKKNNSSSNNNNKSSSSKQTVDSSSKQSKLTTTYDEEDDDYEDTADEAERQHKFLGAFYDYDDLEEDLDEEVSKPLSSSMNNNELSAKILKFENELDMNTQQNIGPAPFHFEERALKELADCDYNIRITLDMAKAGKAPRKIRIYADGIYDMFHAGHARQLMQAKNMLPNSYLIVGVCNDQLTHSKKGRTVMNEAERYESLRHCRYVDEVVTDAPWVLTDEFVKEHKIDLIAHDDIPYVSTDSDDVYAYWKKRGMFMATQRTDGISTSDLICRIVRDYDIYVRRNLKRGYTASDLNVGFFKEKKIRIQNNIETFREKLNKYQEESKEFISKWEEKSREFIHNFLDHFGSRKNLREVWMDTKNKVRRAISPEPLDLVDPKTLLLLNSSSSMAGSTSSAASSSSEFDSSLSPRLSSLRHKQHSAPSLLKRAADESAASSSSKRARDDDEDDEDDERKEDVSPRKSTRTSKKYQRSSKKTTPAPAVDDDEIDSQIPMI